MIQCPTCKREINSGTRCPRCGADLTGITRIIKLAERYFNQGKKQLMKKDFKNAVTSFKTAHGLYHTPGAEKGIIVSLLCLGRFKKGLQAALKIGYFKDTCTF